MNISKLSQYLVVLFKFVMVFIGIVFIWKYGMTVFVSFVVSIIFRQMIHIQSNIAKSILTVVCVILFYVMIVGIIVLLLLSAMYVLNDFSNILYSFFQLELIQNVLTHSLKYLFSLLLKIPSYAMSLFMHVFFTLILTTDTSVHDYLAKYNFYQKFCMLVIRTFQTIIKTYGLNFIVTFVVLLTGLNFLHYEHAIFIAFIIALFDFMPILGIEMIFIPWIIYLFYQQQFFQLGIFMFMYLIIFVLKNIIEVKMITQGQRIPFALTMIFMFLCYKIFGISALFVTPFCVCFFDEYINQKQLTTQENLL